MQTTAKTIETTHYRPDREAGANGVSVMPPMQRMGESEAGASVMSAPEASTAPNLTGLPDETKAAAERLSGFDMSDVRVHWNASEPAEVGALAYTQGTEIFVGPGQEQHVNHEVWHSVQDKQGRVEANTSFKKADGAK